MSGVHVEARTNSHAGSDSIDFEVNGDALIYDVNERQYDAIRINRGDGSPQQIANSILLILS